MLDTSGHIHDAADAEARAALALGRLAGVLSACPADVETMFAGRVLHATLAHALAQDGHAFTPQRFAAWFAGLVPLVETSETRPPRSARALAEVILSEVSLSSWTPLATVAQTLRPAFLAPRDPDAEDTRTNALAAVDDARSLVAALGQPPSPLPFAGLARLHATLRSSARFASPERAQAPMRLGGVAFELDMTPAPAPLWALDLAYGDHLRAGGFLPVSLPCPGLIRHAPALTDDDPDAARIMRANTLADVMTAHLERWREVRALATRVADALAGLRGSSRGPALAALLAGFGPLRSAQIELALGVTRLGVRTIVNALTQANLIGSQTIAGAKLYGLTAGSMRG